MKAKPKDKKRLVLLDSHAIIHRAYHALPEFTSAATGEPTGALYGLVSMLLKMIQDLKPDYIVAAFDLAGPTFRHEAAESYKAGRRENDANLELQLARSKDIFEAFGIPVYSYPGFEADDVIGTVVEELKGDKGMEIIIASGDMDTMQLVDGSKVQVYTLKKGINDTILYDEKKVVERFGFAPKYLVDYKGLRGDPSDNIIGVKGIGEKTATSLIQTFGTIEEIYKELKKKGDGWKKAGITERVKNLLLENEEEALFSKSLATIRLDAPINWGVPEEWLPNFDTEKVLELFKLLGFRTLSERVKAVINKLNNSGETVNSKGESGGDLEVVVARSRVKNSIISPTAAPDSQEVKEICLMLWVIDSNITNPTIDDVFTFTKTRDLAEAKKVLEAELDKREVRNIYEDIERPLMSVIEKMNEAGVKIDKKMLEKLSEDYHASLKKLEKKIWAEAGEEFNINSPKVLSEILFTKLDLAEKRQKKTPTGALSTKESELLKLADKHPIVNHILEYRELSKLLSTYIDTIPTQLDAGSRLHSTFLQSSTTTGRMGSVNPNLQNIPIRTDLGKAIRHAFIAEDGYSLIAFDYSQIELRIAAILSGDEKLIEIFKNGEDVHAGVASRVFNVPPEKVDREMRRRAKIINFGILFGMGVNALRTNLGTDRKEAQEFYNQYFSTFVGLAHYLDQVKAESERRGYTETLFGRRRYFTGFKSPLPYVRAQAERMAINAPIQGTEADVLKIAMKKIDEIIQTDKRDDEVRLLLQVHDELVYEVRDDLVPDVMERFKKVMEGIISEEKSKGVPVLVEAHVAKNWGEMK